MKKEYKGRPRRLYVQGSLPWQGELISVKEFLNRLNKLVRPPVQQMWHCEGDLFVSEFQKLSEGIHRLHEAVKGLDGDTDD